MEEETDTTDPFSALCSDLRSNRGITGLDWRVGGSIGSWLGNGTGRYIESPSSPEQTWTWNLLHALEENARFESCQLAHLHLSAFFGEEDAARFFSENVLANHPTLQKLNIWLNCNKQQQEHHQLLIWLPLALKVNTALTHLEIRGVNFGLAENAERLASGLIRNNTLTSLDLHDCNIGDESCTALATVLRNHSLQELLLCDNEIGSQGCEALISELLPRVGEVQQRSPSSLRCLDLSCNKLNDAGARIIATLLAEKESTMQTIGLSYNGITSDGIVALAEKLEFNNWLKTLRLAGTSFGHSIVWDKVFGALAVALRRNAALEHFLVSRHALPCQYSDALSKLESALRDSNYALRTLDLDGTAGGINRILDANRQIRDKFERFVDDNNMPTTIPTSLWPVALESTGIHSKAGMIYNILRCQPSEWIFSDPATNSYTQQMNERETPRN